MAHSTSPPDKGSASGDAKRAEVQQLLLTEPDLSNREAARRCGVSHTLVHRIRTERRGAPMSGAHHRTSA